MGRWMGQGNGRKVWGRGRWVVGGVAGGWGREREGGGVEGMQCWCLLAGTEYCIGKQCGCAGMHGS
jgi:hypothetical protein